jgi:hypothetical protein
MSTHDAQQFATDPAGYFGDSYEAMHRVDAAELAGLQLEAARWRLAELIPRIGVLTVLAEEQGIDRLDRVDDLAPLLFEHSVYKAYPVSLLERSRFDHLTRWLDRLTSHDLSGVDARGCEGIDAWLDLLDAQTPLRVAHTSGTTGTMSFLPRCNQEWAAMLRAMRCGPETADAPAQLDASIEVVMPMFRQGRGAITRLPSMVAEHWYGGETTHVHVMHEGRMSSDALFVAARMRAAEARGELARLELSPALRARAEEFAAQQELLATGTQAFFDKVVEELAGKTVWLFGTWKSLYDVASASMLRGVFRDDSAVITGGGTKGQVLAADWQHVVMDFVGVPRLQLAYGMTELTGMQMSCEHDRYHVQPWIIPLVLDPGDGRPLPRKGVQTGRAAFYDLVAATYWGGFITGDEVTVHWGPCPCGRTTPQFDLQIQRYTDKQGGDDRIMCSATDEAHTSALRFLGAHVS